MKKLNSKSLAILLFCIAQTPFAAKDPGFGSDLKNGASAGLFSTVTDIKKVNGVESGAAVSSNHIIIDNNNNTLVADDGIKFQYQGLKLQAFGFKRDEVSNIVTATGDVRIEMGDGDNKARIDSSRTLLSLDRDILKYYDSISYMDVGPATGAVAPNDRIYFGGEVGELDQGGFVLKDAWFTTDYQILDTGDYKQGGYYLNAKKLKIIPDDKAVFEDASLHIGDYQIGWFPWYAINIREGSEVPLFPEWGGKTDYGFYITTGFNYGNEDSKFLRGGFAPKYADELGLLVGRFENWFDFGPYGSGLITADDLLVSKKDASIDNRWDINADYEFKNDKGFLKLDFQSLTVNNIDDLEDYRDTLEKKGYYDPDNKDNYSGRSRDDGDAMNFFTLDSEFKKLGSRNDIDFTAKSKRLLGEKHAYREFVDDKMDDASFGAELDFKLYTDLEVIKDNDDYMISAYYDYLEDLVPGSTSSEDDLQSKRENFGMAFNLKEAKIDFAYDHIRGDKLRKLRAWERSPDLEDITKIQGGDIKYVPWSVSEYNRDNSDQIKLNLGEYDLADTGATYKVKLNAFESKKELNIDDDPFRQTAHSSNNEDFNTRDMQYNKDKNILFEKKQEYSVGSEFFYNEYRTELTIGHTKDETWDREGIFNYEDFTEGEAYNKYINESNFVQLELEDKNIDLGIFSVFGEVGLKYNVRYDQYTSGYDTYTGDNSGGDSSIRQQVDFNSKTKIYDNTDNHFRDLDLTLYDQFHYFGQFNSYNSGNRDGDSEYNKRVRLRDKDNIHKFQEKITSGIGNTKAIYDFGYEHISDGFEKKQKKGEVYDGTADFFINDEKKLSLYYNYDKRYTRGELTTDGFAFDDKYNDLNVENFGGSFYINDDFRLYYDEYRIHTYLKDSPNTTSGDSKHYYGSHEKALESTYGLEMKRGLDVYNLTYTHASDNRFDNEQDTLDITNDIIGVSYLNGGDIENFYSASYGNYQYGPSQELEDFSVDQITFRYEYRDKRFSDEELRSYAAAEYNKSSLDITPTEISRVKQILNERNDNQLDFNLDSIMTESMNRPEYKVFFSFDFMAKVHKENYRKTNDFWGSLKELEGSVYGSYKRFGLGYTYHEEADFKNNSGTYNRKYTKQEHELKLRTSIGKPSEGWNIGISYKTEIDKDDEYGVYLGKEMGYYEWSIAFKKKYDRVKDEYDNRVAIQFTLLTFPDNPILGLGYKDNNGHMSPNMWFGDGLKVDKP